MGRLGVLRQQSLRLMKLLSVSQRLGKEKIRGSNRFGINGTLHSHVIDRHPRVFCDLQRLPHLHAAIDLLQSQIHAGEAGVHI
jgi:hypothetical protein